MKKNYSIVEIGSWEKNLAEKQRVMLGQELALTGAEISLNYAAAGQFVPFVHSHKLNEEIYLILSGSGMFMVDEDEFPVQEGSVIRVAPDGQRAIKAADSDAISYVCIQVQAGSLSQATNEDGVISEVKASWMS